MCPQRVCEKTLRFNRALNKQKKKEVTEEFPSTRSWSSVRMKTKLGWKPRGGFVVVVVVVCFG